jgi:autotransporter-associated beta strand protein
MHAAPWTRRLALLLAAAAALSTACDSSHGSDAFAIPAPPAGMGAAETADPPAGVPAYVDTGATNQRNDPCHVTVDTNAGVRVVSGFLDVWTPSTLVVDAGVTLAASGACAAVTPSTWTGVPGDATDGKVKNATVHAANVAYVEAATAARGPAQELAAYLDDRRQKGYSVADGLGPLTAAWRTGTGQTTTITAIAADATTVKYDDAGNNLGVGSATNANLGLAVDFVGAMSTDASTEPAKRFFKYARPWRWSGKVSVVPALVPVKSGTPGTDGGFISGHSAEGWRDALGMAYLVPQRYQELLARAMELGDNRILAGMHSPLDVIGGRIQATAVVAYSLNKLAAASSTLPATAHQQAQTYLQGQAGVTSAAGLLAVAHAGSLADDRFADRDANAAAFAHRLTYGFAPIAATTAGAVVPKGAEVLLETRLPYLTAAQRRVVLKTTALPSGFPVLDDAEGWGRLNLFAAADGYGAFHGDVAVAMDAAQGGFSAEDTWRNDIAGAGKLTKLGSGTLRLAGANRYAGGTEVQAGALVAAGTSALGAGDVYVSGGTLRSDPGGFLAIPGAFTLRSAGTLEVAIREAGQGALVVGGAAVLDGGTLHVTFPGAYRPAVGDTLWVLAASARHGQFALVTVDGFAQVTPVYGPEGVQLKLVAK